MGRRRIVRPRRCGFRPGEAVMDSSGGAPRAGVVAIDEVGIKRKAKAGSRGEGIGAAGDRWTIGEETPEDGVAILVKAFHVGAMGYAGQQMGSYLWLLMVGHLDRKSSSQSSHLAPDRRPPAPGAVEIAHIDRIVYHQVSYPCNRELALPGCHLQTGAGTHVAHPAPVIEPA